MSPIPWHSPDMMGVLWYYHLYVLNDYFTIFVWIWKIIIVTVWVDKERYPVSKVSQNTTSTMFLTISRFVIHVLWSRLHLSDHFMGVSLWKWIHSIRHKKMKQYENIWDHINIILILITGMLFLFPFSALLFLFPLSCVYLNIWQCIVLLVCI